MSLINTDSVNGYIEATATDGYAVSNVISQTTTYPPSITITDPYNLSQQSEYSTVHNVIEAFNNNLTTRWSAALNNMPSWVAIDFKQPTPVNQIDINVSLYPDQGPNDFTIEGSNNNIDWTILMTNVGILWGAEYQSFIFENNTEYQYYKINISAANTTAVTITNILLKNNEPDFVRVKNIIAQYDFTNISNSGTNSNELLIYEVDATNTYASSEFNGTSQAFQAFDGSTTVYWHSNGTDGVGDWIVRRLATPIALARIDFMHGNVVGDYDRTWNQIEISGSNDNTNWTVIHVEIDITDWQDDIFRTINIPTDGTTYSDFKLTALARNGVDYYSYVKEIKMYSEVIDTDILKTTELIKDGDKLVIVKDDNSINELVASSVTGSGPYEMDTTAITAGEVPTRVYRVDEGVEFNASGSVMNSDAYLFSDPILKSSRSFNDVDISGRTVATKVNMSATGNKLISLDYDLLV